MMTGYLGVMMVKMMNNLFNTPFEMELRILIVLSQTSDVCTTDRILSYDFMACYSAEFKLNDTNLHGINNYKFGEIASRKELVTEAIKSLVVKGLVRVEIKDGYYFIISDMGQIYINRFESAYAMEYRNNVKSVVEAYGDKEDKELLRTIQKNSIIVEG